MKNNSINISNEKLQILLKKGDEDAFNEIYNRFWDSLYRYAYRIFNDELICEDIVQEVFINLWEKATTVEIQNIEAYLFRAIKYRVATHIRDLKFTTTHLEILENIPQIESTERVIEYQEFENNVFLEIEKLSPKCKTVFQLSRFDHLSNNEIALKLNISVRTVEKHISDAIKSLKNSLNFTVISFWITTTFF
ncbi:RNA polymerase sigma factor [Flavobacterium sp. UMI-01]|uniref:RNA polymerase sigma factor n=1 Tax=Flavobacterium sp. UMI-01 TaxID=1441053 RepID=UPI001C7CA661|nr:RNA polymerase sigma-70 factor [Flavobacterium sp. UMI-01]GIZ07557.1 RNA polymerase sigma-70 factor [Flavobacterium sp. UMI-01]